MARQSRKIDFDNQREFLRNVLDAAEKRRNGVEHKAAIVLATNSILLTFLARFLDSSFLASIGLKSLDRIAVGILLAVVIAAGISMVLTMLVLVGFTGKRRHQILKVSEDEFNVFYVGKIAKFSDASAYQETVKSLTADDLLEQLTSQAYRLSLLIVDRYKWFNLALGALSFSILLFLVFIIVLFVQ
jgi:hypothetical protein